MRSLPVLLIAISVSAFMSSPAFAAVYTCMEMFAPRSHNEIALIMQAIPEQEIRAVDRLRDLTFETGRTLRLSKIEIEEVIATFAETGALGGDLHVYSLFDGIDVNGVHEAIYASARATKADLKSAFAPLLQKNAGRDPARYKASKMVQWLEIYSSHNLKQPRLKRLNEALHDPRHQALLRLWFEVSMQSMVKVAIDAAPYKLTRQAAGWGQTISTNAKWPTLVGTVGTIALLHPSLMTSVEIFGSGLGLFTAGINANKLPLFGWLTNRFASAQQRRLRAVEPLKQLALEPTAAEKTAIGLPAIPAFEFNEPFTTFTLPLRAEIARQEFSIEIETGETDASLTHVMDSVVPVLRLTTDTFTAQIVRLKDVEAKADEFISKHENIRVSDPRLSRSDSEHIETNAVRLREHLLALKADLSYTLQAMGRQKSLLKYAVEQANGRFPERADQLQYFHQYAIDAEAKLVAKAREHIKTIDTRLFELNKQVLMPLID